MLGAHLISTYAGMNYTDFVAARMFQPLNMSSTTFYRTPNLTECWKDGRLIPTTANDNTVDLKAGPGGIMSNALDMGKYTLMLLNGGVNPVTNQTIIPEKTFKEITMAHAVTGTSDGGVSAYGEGWWRSTYRGRDVLQHSGSTSGFASLCTILPSRGEEPGISVTVLVNTDGKANQTTEITRTLLRSLLGSDVESLLPGASGDAT